jgi:putative glycosyltransferase (TIGR04372 family)
VRHGFDRLLKNWLHWVRQVASPLPAAVSQPAAEQDASKLDDVAGYSLSIGRLDLAREALLKASRLGLLSAQRTYELGISYLFDGLEHEALPWLKDAISRERRFASPYHDNGSWPHVPTAQEEAFGADRLLYDAYNYLGQYVLHIGDGQHRSRFHRRAFEIQQALKSRLMTPNAAVIDFLADRNMSLERLRILPFEWATQIGHLGMLDVLMRMRQLGWWSGDAILLVPRSRISNEPFLEVLSKHWAFELVFDDGSDLALGLLDLVRSHGMPYYAWRLPNGDVIPWHEAGALALRECEDRDIEHTLWQTYDRLAGEGSTVRDQAALALRSWGIAPGDPFVCLHIRESSFYGKDRERPDSGAAVRNADPENYEAMIKDLTGRGIRVIKMGAENSPIMPEVPGFIDYARSRFKSPSLDLFLIRHARYFIGTTSGLVNVAVSFDRPAAIINCITTESQLWHSKARFLPKVLRDSDGKTLTWSRMTSDPWRWAVCTVETMKRYGLTATDNSSDEILYAAAAAERLSEGRDSQDPMETGLLDRWRSEIQPSHNYGCGLPVGQFLRKHQEMFGLPSPRLVRHSSTRRHGGDMTARIGPARWQ